MAGRLACVLGLLLGGGSASAGIHIFGTGFDSRPEGPHSQAEAARFLTQATFGPSLPEIDRLMRMGYHAWLDEQLAAPASLQLPYLDGLIHGYLNAGQPVAVWQDARQEIWWRNVLYGNDQLRQRVAFALSQILVISDQNGALEGLPTALAHYYDLLAQQAFGNYRQLLQDVTLHPAMGNYLSMFRNRKPDEALNIRPDENYAREIMQLFSIGLVRLNPDGTPLDGDPGTPGVQPMPTYDQDTIRGFAHVFTGWNFSTCQPPEPSGGGFTWWHWEYCPSGPDTMEYQLRPGWRTPMAPWGSGTAFGEVYHASEGNKQLLAYPGVSLPGGVLPAGGSAQGNLQAALDNIFNHPNVGPFIGRLLIQRLTTSNPSPAYVGRVAAAFANDGQGVRGNLAAVVRAVLMDPEARDPAQRPAHFGKLREPLLRLTGLWRALDARSNSGRVGEGWPEYFTAQAVQRSPTVFNFYLPNYQLPGEIANLGLYSPEFQITTDTYLTRLSNALRGFSGWAWRGNPGLGAWDPLQVVLQPYFDQAHDMDRVLDRFDLLFMARGMSMPMFEVLRDHAEDIDIGPFDWDETGNVARSNRRERIHDTLWLLLTSPEYVVER
jgi:uncharacterized protein (DUF1800 family)